MNNENPVLFEIFLAYARYFSSREDNTSEKWRRISILSTSNRHRDEIGASQEPILISVPT